MSDEKQYGDYMTAEDFANWILQLPDDVKKRKISFIDITKPYKGKGLYVDETFSKEFITIEDCHDEEGEGRRS